MLFPIPVITLFWIDQLGMSLAQVMWLQAAFNFAFVVAEFPSGYFADRVGHRASLILGAAVCMLAWLLYARAQGIGAVVVAELVLGIGLAFTSGADSALLYRTLAAQGRDDVYRRYEGRTRAAMQTAEAASSVIGGACYAVAPRLPFWLQLPAAAAGVACTLAMHEPPRVALGAVQSHFAAAVHLARHTLWTHARLRSAVALWVALSVPTLLLVWLVQPYMRSRGVPVAWFGAVWAGANLWLAGVSLVSDRLGAALGIRRTLLACCLLIVVGYGLMASTTAVWGITFYLAAMTLRGLQSPILITALQGDAPDDDRAGVLSLAVLCMRLVAMVVGPPLGMLVDGAGLDVALTVAGGAFFLAALTALRMFVRAHGVP